MNIRDNIIERKFAFVFKVVLLFYLFFQSLVIFHRTPFARIALWSMLFLGGIVCILRILNVNKYINTKGLILLALFLLSYVVAIICNYKYGIGEDLANLVILSLTIAVGYVTNSEYKKEDVRKEMEIISHIFIIIMDISIIVSIAMLFLGYGDIWYIEGYRRTIGFVENRLWGVFGDPNLAAIFCVVSMFLCIYFLKTARRKVLYIVTLVLIFLYLAFSDSRTGSVCLFVSSAFGIFMLLSKALENKCKNILLGKCLSVIIAVTIALGIGAVPEQLQNGYNSVVEYINSNKTDGEGIDLTIKREYDMSQDITNKRLEIWISGIEIFLDKPITGIGFHHLQDYARQELPETYLAQEDVTYSHLHNEILNILVSQGILGFVPIFLFAISSIIDVFKRYLTLKDKEYFGYTIGIGCILTICVGIMINQGIMYSYMPINLLFWMYLSYMRNTKVD